MKPFGALMHQRAGTVRWDIVRRLLPTAVPAAFGGVFLLRALGDGDDLQQRVKYGVGTALLLAVVGMLTRLWLDRRRAATGADAEDAHVPVRPVPTLLIGLAGGAIVGMTSVGSGSLIIVMLMLAHPRLKANHLVGTDLVQAIPMVAAAALGHLLVGDADLGLAATVLIGAVPGVLLGSVISSRVAGGAVRWALVVLLTGSGLSMLKASSTVVVLGCLAMALLGGIVGMRDRRTAHHRAAAGTAGETADETAADAVGVSGGS
ncbi:sulfite exporter TauE/SafE family protein [Streptomyces sp. NPDC054804]